MSEHETRATALMAGHGVVLWQAISTALRPPFGAGRGVADETGAGATVICVSLFIGLAAAFLSLFRDVVSEELKPYCLHAQIVSACILGGWLLLFSTLVSFILPGN